MLKVYGFAPTRTIRVAWTLQEIGVPFEYVTVDLTKGENRRPELLSLNPAGKLPVLVDGDLVLTESVAIVVYLAEKYPEARLLPKNLADRAQAMRWLLFAATELEQPLWRIAHHTTILPPDRRVPADIPLAQADFRKMAAVLEEHMTGRTFLVGEDVTVADFVMAYTLDWGNEAKLLDRSPNLRAYLERMYARPNAVPRIEAAFAAIGVDPRRS